jgi:membrane protein involved in colicin uptake
MDIINDKPVKAFIYQDHEAHLTVHMTAMQDPKIRQLMGQNPKANQMMSALQAHIAEHVAFAYRNKIEEQLGAPLPKPDEDMPEELELQVSRLAAEAGKRLLTVNQQEAAQQQAQQQAQDPIVQMQQQELALKKAEFELKKQKMMADAATTAEQLKLKEKEFLADTAAKADELKLKEKEILAEAAAKADELRLKGEIEGVRVGVDIGKAKDNLRQRTPK